MDQMGKPQARGHKYLAQLVRLKHMLVEGQQYSQYQCQVQTFEGVADDAKVAIARTEQPGDENAGFSDKYPFAL
ncbi:hypothetical protein V6N13_001991 [Hibiscus sabdariffa]